MEAITCPNCGQLSARGDVACSSCGHNLNGVASPATPGLRPLPAGIPDGSFPPELRAWAQETLDVEQFLADLREVEQTGGLELKDFIGEIEEIVNRRE